MDNQKDKKITKVFYKIGVILSNRKKESSKVYFSKPSLKSIFLSIFSSLLVVDFIFRFMKLFDYENVNVTENIYQLGGIAGGVMLAIVIMIVVSKQIILKYFKYISAPLVIIGILFSYYSFNNFSLALGSTLLGFGYGIIFGLIVNLFLYSFGMSERLIFSLVLIMLFFSYSFYFNVFIGDMVKRIYIPSCLAIIVYLLFIFCNDYFVINDRSEKVPTYSLVLLIAMLFIVCMNQAFVGAIELSVHTSGIQASKSYYSTTYYIGFVICCLVTVFAFLYSKKAMILLIIIYFMSVFGAHQLTIFNTAFDGDVVFWRQAADVAYGFSNSLGYITIFMLIAKILDDKASRFNPLYVSLCTICFTFSSVFLRKYLMNIDIRALAIALMIINFVIGVIIIIINVLEYIRIISTNNVVTEIADKVEENDVVVDPNEVLTPKEKVVFELLIEGLTLRQIAGELSMKYDSVNFHYKNIYRKLGVNSKIELILRYGDLNK